MPLLRPRRVVGIALAALAGAAAVGVHSTVVAPAQAVAAPFGQSVQTNGTPTAGALFPGGIGGRHTCSGTIVATNGAPVVATAAHCITGNAVGWTFAPGYHDGIAPLGAWRVNAVFVDPRWNGGRGWQYDVAILRLDTKWINGGQRHVGYLAGSTVLHSTPAAGTAVSLTGYAAGYGGKPWTCTNRITRPYQSAFVTCNWLPTGVSGSGFRYGNDGRGHAYLGGVLGGYRQGGCYVNEGYSSVLGSWVSTLVARANSGQRSDWVPTAVWDGCNNVRP